MMSQEQAKTLLNDAIAASLADQTEILMIRSNAGLSRFANSQIHQSTNRLDDYLQVRSIVGKKVGVASTNQIDNLKSTVEKAYEAAKLATESHEAISLPSEGSLVVDAFRYSRRTAEYGPLERAAYIEKVITEAKDYQAAGIFETGEAVMAVANSNAIFSYQKQTEADLNAIFYNDHESSFAYRTDFDVSKINPTDMGQEAFEIASKSKESVTLEPGRYTVILKPAAVAEMLGLLAFSGLGALSFIEGRSFMNNKIGRKIASSGISLQDAAKDPRSLGWLFDYEGVKRQKVDIIAEGIAKEVVYDSFTANKSGHPNTGHALPATSKYGPLPMNLMLETGDTPVEEMLADTQKGLLINRFHYTNLEDPLKTVFTGMTKDGTFLIENGKATKAVTNMRITQSILKALSDVVAISSEGTLAAGLTGSYFVPALKIKNINFSSVTTA